LYPTLRATLRYAGGMATEGKAGPRMVFCVKLHKELPGLQQAPFEGHPIGRRIYENVSEEAWKMWLDQMRIIMNEYRLNLSDPQAQQALIQLMEQYFFGEGAALPPEYVPPASA
jgi:Fe-S cluster biosynthesis and repair protein YggX